MNRIHPTGQACGFSAHAIKFPVVPKEVIDKVLTSDDGWTTVYEGPTIRMTKTIPEGDGLVGADSIRAGIDAEILNKLSNAGIDVLKEVQETASQFMAQALAEEEAAIVDDLKRQMEAGCVMPQIYVPLQVSHIFKKEE